MSQWRHQCQTDRATEARPTLLISSWPSAKHATHNVSIYVIHYTHVFHCDNFTFIPIFSTIQIGQGVTALWGVENGPSPLLWPVAYTTACTTVQATTPLYTIRMSRNLHVSVFTLLMLHVSMYIKCRNVVVVTANKSKLNHLWNLSATETCCRHSILMTESKYTANRSCITIRGRQLCKNFPLLYIMLTNKKLGHRWQTARCV